MAELVKVEDDTWNWRDSAETTTSTHGAVTQTKSSGARTDTAPMHRGIEVSLEFVLRNPNIGASGGTLSCP